MDVTNRKENNLLNRVEIEFSIKHGQKATPSRREMIDLVVKTEPGSKAELIILKRVNTRFGQALTTGFAHVYSDEESLKSTEMEYMIKRHTPGDEPEVVEKASKEEPGGEEE
jgi:small subunit ribosomal protein S24e